MGWHSEREVEPVSRLDFAILAALYQYTEMDAHRQCGVAHFNYVYRHFQFGENGVFHCFYRYATW